MNKATQTTTKADKCPSVKALLKASPIWGEGGEHNALYYGPYMCKFGVWRRIRKY